MKKGLLIALVLLFITGIAENALTQTLTASGVININTATEEQLRMLPLIDAQLAHNIFMYRTNNGPFFTMDELMNVKGMTSEKFEELKPWLVTEGSTTFSPDLFQERYKNVRPGPVY